MKYFFFLSSFFPCIILFTSCQKEFSSNTTDTPTTPSDSTLLIKFVEIDSSVTADTTSIFEITYDNLKRAIHTNSYFSADATYNINNYVKDDYYYNGNDTLPYMKTRESKSMLTPGDISIRKDTSYYTFDNTGKLITDSTNITSITNSSTQHYYIKETYSYDIQAISRLTTSTYNNVLSKIIDSSYYTSTGINTTFIRNRILSYPTMSLHEEFTHQMSFDNHPNPFNRIAAFRTQVPYFEYEDGRVGSQQPNNLLSDTESYLGAVSTTNTFVYKYRSNGLPSLYSRTQVNGNQTQYIKGVFTYGTR